MSNREKGAWAELVTLVVVWGFYFISLIGAVASGDLVQRGFADTMGLTFAVCIGLSILISVAVGLLIEFSTRRSHAPARAERDAWAGLRATRLAHGVLVSIILLLTALGFLLGAPHEGTLQSHVERWLDGLMGNGLVLFANGALAAFLLAELIHYGALIVFLRRGR